LQRVKELYEREMTSMTNERTYAYKRKSAQSEREKREHLYTVFCIYVVLNFLDSLNISHFPLKKTPLI